MMITTSFGAIRPWSVRDAESLALYANNPKVAANLRDMFPHPYSLDDAQRFLAFATEQTPTCNFAITVDDQAVGGIGLSPGADVHRLTAEFGYWLGEPFWGRGIVTESVQRFTTFAFAAFGLVRLYAEPYITNQGSCRVLEKSGFTLEGILRANVIKHGRILDQALYAKIQLPA